ncbi:hypothetical protein [Streptomyces bauhiniae]|uniref:hypothetical protein n=1 Tax=Streptomyces bauhiniae TaxID=2340725 RepID=UPI00364E5414
MAALLSLEDALMVVAGLSGQLAAEDEAHQEKSRELAASGTEASEPLEEVGE